MTAIRLLCSLWALGIFSLLPLASAESQSATPSVDECLQTSVDTASVAYQCCKAYRFPESKTSEKTFECCVKNKGALSEEQVKTCLSATGTAPGAYTREIAFLAAPKTVERSMTISPGYEAPALEAIPWVAMEVPQPEVTANYIEAPRIEARLQPVATADVDDLALPPDTQPVDECLKDYPDVNSQGYKCCKDYRPTRKVISRESTGTAPPLTNYFECCMAPENIDGLLDHAELQACECKSRPEEPLCNCMGVHQADAINACFAQLGSERAFTHVSEPPSYVYSLGKLSSRMPISLPECSCPSPQPFKSTYDCGAKISSIERSASIYEYPCLYAEQVDALKKAGHAIEAVSEGFRVTAKISAERCAALKGSAVSAEPAAAEPVQQPAPAEVMAEAELAPVSDAIRRRLAVELTEREGAVAEQNVVLCTFVKAACPCDQPPPPPEIPPEETPPEETPPTKTPPTPPPPTPTTPEAKVEPRFRMAVSGWGDFHAVLLDNEEVISLKEATPGLPRQAITTDAAFRVYKAFAAYDKNPNAENLAKLRGLVNENLLGEIKETPHYGLMLLTPPVEGLDDEGAAAVPADFATVRAQFVQKAIELNTTDGTLRVNKPEALQVFRPGPAALAAEGEPEIVSMSQLFKTLADGEEPRILLFTVDAAQAAGGGCSLLR